MRIVKPPLEPLGLAGTSVLSNIRPLPSVLPAGFTLTNIRPLQNFPGNALFSPRHGESRTGGEKDRPDRFLRLRESLATKRQAEPWVRFGYPQIRYDRLGLKGEFAGRMMDRALPPHGVTMDADDPIIGPYIRELEDATAEIKKSSGGQRLKLPEYRALLRTIILKCFTIARDMTMIIGRERHDLVRKKLNLQLNQRYSAQRLLSLPVSVLADELIENKHSYRQMQPLMWAEGLMLLALNPELTDAIIASPLKSEQSARDWALHFAEKEEAKADKRAQARAKRTNRQKHIDYMRRSIASEALPHKTVGLVARGVAVLTPDEISLLVSRRNCNHSFSMEQMDAIFQRVIGKMDEKAQNYFLAGLHNLVKVIADYDDAYRTDHAEEDSFITSDAVVAAAQTAVKRDIRNKKAFEPFTEWIHDSDGAERRRYRINAQQGDAGQRNDPVLSLLDVIDMKKHFGKLPIDEAIAFAEERGLKNEIRENLRDASSRAVRAIADYRRQMSEKPPLRRHTLDGDSMYNLFAKMRYAFKVFPHLYPEIWERVTS